MEWADKIKQIGWYPTEQPENVDELKNNPIILDALVDRWQESLALRPVVFNAPAQKTYRSRIDRKNSQIEVQYWLPDSDGGWLYYGIVPESSYFKATGSMWQDTKYHEENKTKKLKEEL